MIKSSSAQDGEDGDTETKNHIETAELVCRHRMTKEGSVNSPRAERPRKLQGARNIS